VALSANKHHSARGDDDREGRNTNQCEAKEIVRCSGDGHISRVTVWAIATIVDTDLFWHSDRHVAFLPQTIAKNKLISLSGRLFW